MSGTALAKEAAVLTGAEAFDHLVSRLRGHAEERPDEVSLTFLKGTLDQAHPMTYAEIDLRARGLAEALRAKDPECEGKRAILVFPPGLDFVIGYLGCLYAGVVAVPTNAPHPAQLRRSLERFLVIARDTDPTYFLTAGSYFQGVKAMMTAVPKFRKSHAIDLEKLDFGTLARSWRPPAITPDSIAFLQYTSGSTAVPKGVMVSHGNLVHNLQAIQKLAADTSDPQGVIWLPPYHDMGLIGGILEPLYVGFPCALISPLEFLQRPQFWFEAMTHFRATVSSLPNFALEYCSRKVTDDELATYDLSRWQVAINGGEPVRKNSLDRFTERFSACGFRAEVHKPAYGLAEGTLMTSCEYRRIPPHALEVSRSGCESGKAESPRGAADTRVLVSCGKPINGMTVQIVHSKTLELLPEGEIGEIWIAGPSVTKGYWNRPRETEETFGGRIAGSDEGPFLRSGDLGFIRDGELYVTGRAKDLIIVAGKNHCPQDIELAAESAHPAIRPGSTIAFGIEDERTGEKVVLVLEADRRRLQRKFERRHDAERQTNPDVQGLAPEPRLFDTDEVVRMICTRVRAETGIDPAEVVLVRPGTVPKTSSGKVQRARCRKQYLGGELKPLRTRETA